MIRAGLAFALLACAADARPREPREPGDAGRPALHGALLTASAPRQDVAIAAPAAAPSTLIVTITAIENPGEQAFSLAASVVWTGGGAAVEAAIATVTPYPPSAGGSYALGVPGAARQVLGRPGGQLALRLALQPVAADRPLRDPLRVTLGDPAWR